MNFFEAVYERILSFFLSISFPAQKEEILTKKAENDIDNDDAGIAGADWGMRSEGNSNYILS